MSRWLITNARLVSEGETIETDVRIERGRIDRIGGELRARPRETVVNAHGRYLLPGMIDSRVHFREPGRTRQGSISTESRAAVAGGVTSFLDLPDTLPPTTSRRALADKFSRAGGRSTANYSFYLGASPTNLEEIARTLPAEACGLAICVGGCRDAIEDPEQLAKFANASTLPVTLYGESNEIVETNRASVLGRQNGALPASVHPEIHSREACRLALDLAGPLAERSTVQVADISTKEEAAALECGLPGRKRLTASVSLPNLYFMEADYESLGNLIKNVPPIRTADDRLALRRALADDRIDIIASGHAPQLLRNKGPRYDAAKSGMPVVQFALPAAWSLVASKTLTPEKLIEKLAHNPARRFGFTDRGFAREGYWADLVLLDTTRRCEVDEQAQLSQCGWTPFTGRKLPASVAATWVNGKLVWRAGLLTGQMPGQLLKRENN